MSNSGPIEYAKNLGLLLIRPFPFFYTVRDEDAGPSILHLSLMALLITAGNTLFEIWNVPATPPTIVNIATSFALILTLALFSTGAAASAVYFAAKFTKRNWEFSQIFKVIAYALTPLLFFAAISSWLRIITIPLAETISLNIIPLLFVIFVLWAYVIGSKGVFAFQKVSMKDAQLLASYFLAFALTPFVIGGYFGYLWF